MVCDSKCTAWCSATAAALVAVAAAADVAAIIVYISLVHTVTHTTAADMTYTAHQGAQLWLRMLCKYTTTNEQSYPLFYNIHFSSCAA
jgi:hypothetical protein